MQTQPNPQPPPQPPQQAARAAADAFAQLPKPARVAIGVATTCAGLCAASFFVSLAWHALGFFWRLGATLFPQ